jgi:beta-aspartyl-peptidase (threonine type)
MLKSYYQKSLKLSLSDATDQAIDSLTKLGGEGGLIAVDSKGNLAMKFNSEGMYRGYYQEGGEIGIGLYKD